MVLIIDNYDSFTYNLVHYVEEISGTLPRVMRNDQIEWESIKQFSHVILSPGPGLPEEAGSLIQLINEIHQTHTMMGVCLGHQAIYEFFGGKLVNLEQVMHGVSRKISCHSSAIYKGLPSSFKVGRYHSWVADHQEMPDCLIVTSTDESGHIMSFEHKSLPIFGVQYHPESVLTEFGKEILSNWLSSTGYF